MLPIEPSNTNELGKILPKFLFEMQTTNVGTYKYLYHKSFRLTLDIYCTNIFVNAALPVPTLVPWNVG